MGTATALSRRGLDLAAIAIVIVGLQQGLVPLGLRLAIGHRERFALASYLPSPWWWMTCLVIVVAAGVLFMRVDAARHDGAGADTATASEGGAGAVADLADAPESSDAAESSEATEGSDAVSGFVLLVGIYNGVVPFVARVFDTQLLLAFPTRLDAPWWWIASSAVCIATVAVLSWLGRTEPRRSDDG